MKAPVSLGTYVVTKDYIPENNDTLTLIKDDLVYLFNKETNMKGFWLGETKGLTGLFPSAHVKPLNDDRLDKK